MPRLLALDRFQARLSGGPVEERVLWLRFASWGVGGGEGEGTHPDVVRGVVLRPLGPGRWCRVDAPFLNADTVSPYTTEPWLCEPPVFSFVNLTSGQHRVFRLVQTEHPCMGSAAGHLLTQRLSFWELQGARMQQIFEKTLFQSSPSLSRPGSTDILEARVRVVGKTFPKQLVVTGSVSELFSEEPESVSRERYRYDEGARKYVWEIP